MTDIRKCEKCVFAKPYGGENDNRCSSWDCEFIDRKEAVEAYRWSKALESAPTVDAVEVVRCKDCKEYEEWDGDKICMRLGGYHGRTKPNDYCSYGERRND